MHSHVVSRLPRILAPALGLLLVSGLRAETWTEVGGRAITASFVRLEGDAVVLKVGAESHPVPLARLTVQDQKTARERGYTATAPPVELGPNGKLVYNAYTPQGDRIPDFSRCGYGGGGVPLPVVPVKLTLTPGTDGKDDLPRLQAAVDQLSKTAAGADGIRGAILLKRGTFRLSGSLRIRTGGIVIRGEGADEKGTVLLGTTRKDYPLIAITGTPSKPLPKTSRKVVNDYVPVGSAILTVDDASGFKTGDTISVTRIGNAAWIRELKMDQIQARDRDEPELTKQWGPFDIAFDRSITAITGNTLTLDAPMVNSIDTKWGGGSVMKIEDDGEIQRVGVENLFGLCEFDAKVTQAYRGKETRVDENHVGRLVTIQHARNVWARDLGARYLQGVVELGSGVRYSTVQDCTSVEPISQITGGRRYTYYSNGQLNLWQRCRADESRHAFVYGSRVPGPNVFLDCEATNEYGSSEAHHRWSVGGLYDNVKGNVAVNDRQFMGSGHGWGGANYVIWNGEGALMLQSPPTARNTAIGFVGKISKPSFGETTGTLISLQTHVKPRSLYVKQLEDRLGPQAVQSLAAGK